MSQPSWIGQTLGGRYLIEDELGHGGMSTVYKATDPNLRRVVAIKLIHAHLSRDPEFIRRFEAEATAVAQLRHPNIIQVFDFNHEGDTYFIVFEFVPGETLQAQLKRFNDTGRQMQMDQLIKIAMSVGSALQYAHDRDIIHRDIKPANVMLNVQGEAILADFGIVKIMGGAQHTATGAVLGTARYMSPEQIKGQRVDARSDIYSYGTMLYEMVGGRAPYNADSAMTLMMMHVNDPVPDVRHIRAGVVPELVMVINKAMAKEPVQRYQSMSELLRDLQRVQGSSPVVGMGADVTTKEAALTEFLEPESAYTDPGTYATQVEELVQPTHAPTKTTAAPKKNRTMIWGIGLLFIAAAIVIGFFILRPSQGSGNGVDTPEANVISLEETVVSQVVAPQDTATSIPPTVTIKSEPTDVPPTATLAPSATNPPTATNPPSTATSPPPTATSPPPTATSPPPTEVTQLSAQITSISIEGDVYMVSYETFGYTETLPGQHLHFFFNTVSQDQAGSPGSGPWILYGGPRPFREYSVADRPGNATQMCVLVANSDHSVIVNSGNCVNLP